MKRVKTLVVFPVAAFYFAVMARCVGTNELMSDTKFGGGSLKQVRQISSAVGEFKSIVCVDALYSHPAEGILLEQPFEEIGRKEGSALWVGG